MLEKLTGLWLLESAESRIGAEETLQPFGPAPKGRLYYGADGQMMVQIASSQRHPFAADDVFSGTDAEVRVAFTGFSSYFGRYTVDERNREITHHIQGCWFPNWEGTDLKRHYAVTEDRLILSTGPISSSRAELNEARHILTWLRV